MTIRGKSIEETRPHGVETGRPMEVTEPWSGPASPYSAWSLPRPAVWGSSARRPRSRCDRPQAEQCHEPGAETKLESTTVNHGVEVCWK